jgi:hypothetical protein
VDRHQERTEHAELLAGIIAAEVANRGVRYPKKWAVPAEFMPSRMGRSEDAPVRKKRVSQKELANKFRSVFTGLMAAQNGG